MKNQSNKHIYKLNQENLINQLMKPNQTKNQYNKHMDKSHQINHINGSNQFIQMNKVSNLPSNITKSGQIKQNNGLIQPNHFNNQKNQMIKSGQSKQYNQYNKSNQGHQNTKQKQMNNQNKPLKVINNQNQANQNNHINIKQSSSKKVDQINQVQVQKKPPYKENNKKQDFHNENVTTKKSETSNISNQSTETTKKKKNTKEKESNNSNVKDNNNINSNINNKNNNKQDNKGKLKLENSRNNNITPNVIIEPHKKIDYYVNLIHEENNSSFIISCIYCLANNENIKEYLFKKYTGKSVTEIGLTYFFWRILVHLTEKDKLNYKINPFYKNIINANRTFETSNNAVDFIVFLLDKFHNEDKKINKINQEIELKEDMYNNISQYRKYLDKYENSYIFNNYAWINQKIVKCLSCKKETKTYTYYFTYDLNISSALNKSIINSKLGKNPTNHPVLYLSKCFDYALDKEMLFNVYCPSCDKKTRLERFSKIYSLSNYLIILLSGLEQKNNIRSIQENNVTIKIQDKIKIKKLDDSEIEYKINSIIYYDLNNKRYITYYFENNLWIKHDIVIKVEKSGNFLNVFNFNIIPIIIFYESTIKFNNIIK